MRLNLPTTFVLLTIMIDAMGIGLIMPVMPDLIQEVQGAGLSNAAIWGGILTTTYAVMQFVFGPIIGNLSDRFGRRPILLISLFVMAADYIVMALAGSIWLLLVGRIVGGITAATHSTASAFMADTLPPEKRGQGFGMVSAAFGLGFVLGPLIGGILGDLGTRAPFYAAAALAGANFLFGLLILPETVTDENRRPFRWRRANPLGAFANVSALPGLGRMLIVFFLYQVSFNVYPVIWSYYTTAQFGWDSSMIGVSLAAFGISMAIVQGGLIRLALSKLGERRTVFLGFVFGIVSFILLAIVTSGWLALVLTPIAAMAAMAAPAIQALMSRETAADAQGELQGVIASVSALAMIVSPLLMTRVFAYFTADDAPIFLPGAPFLASLLLLFVGIALFLTQNHKQTSKSAP
ncbi:TCR/Tet family MFS transporter [Roseovarius sp. 2305UL8-3]|uniref:TCR/Tet family MFS transporter n=1 Tax=Roseovarius conchicola TaxID=3121636 RepID=UPI0035273957